MKKSQENATQSMVPVGPSATGGGLLGGISNVRPGPHNKGERKCRFIIKIEALEFLF